MKAKQAVVLSKDPLDAFGRENLGKRQTVAVQKGIDHFLKTAAVTTRGIWYSKGHEKNLLGFSRASKPRRASISYQGRLHFERSPWLKRILQNFPLQTQLNLRANRNATVPFGSDPHRRVEKNSTLLHGWLLSPTQTAHFTQSSSTPGFAVGRE